jgi:hypothetical protein
MVNHEFLKGMLLKTSILQRRLSNGDAKASTTIFAEIFLRKIELNDNDLHQILKMTREQFERTKGEIKEKL